MKKPYKHRDQGRNHPTRFLISAPTPKKQSELGLIEAQIKSCFFPAFHISGYKPNSPPWLPGPCTPWSRPASLPSLSLTLRTPGTPDPWRSTAVVPPAPGLRTAIAPVRPQLWSVPQENLNRCSSPVLHNQSPTCFPSYQLPRCVILSFTWLVNDSFPLDRELHEERDHNVFFTPHYISYMHSYWAQQMIKGRCPTDTCRINHDQAKKCLGPWLPKSRFFLSWVSWPGFMPQPSSLLIQSPFPNQLWMSFSLQPKALTQTHRRTPSSKPGSSTPWTD